MTVQSLSVHKHSEELLNGYKKQAEEAGIANVNLVIEYGSPKNIITKELSTVVDADLIICGATGLNAVERFLIGSVSEAIVRSAKCDVLVIRTPENNFFVHKRVSKKTWIPFFYYFASFHIRTFSKNMASAS